MSVPWSVTPSITRWSRCWNAQLVQQTPAALRRSFTLLEFARILASPNLPLVPVGDVGVRLRELVPLAARYRSLSGPVETQDVPDPYGRDRAAYELAYGLISDAVDAIARGARG